VKEESIGNFKIRMVAKMFDSNDRRTSGGSTWNNQKILKMSRLIQK
jgi:hypothetical protein